MAATTLSASDTGATALVGTLEDVAFLRTPRAVRERSRRLFELACAERSSSFRVDLDALDRVADFVSEIARASIERRDAEPACAAVPHGRMRHFDVGGKARTAELEARLASLPDDERARAKIDLVLPSVLLDAGAGSTWSYVDEGEPLCRSEGLAVASLRWFLEGGLAGDGKSARVDAGGLSRVDAASLGRAFQVSPANPLVGLEGRARMLVSLGRALEARPDLFGPEGRPGALFDALLARSENGRVRADAVLAVVLEGLSAMGAGRYSIAGETLGDAWPHPSLGEATSAGAVVPFHKLPQWLVYSLAEPLREGGLEVVGFEELTGLSEYRTGGLLVDLGVVSLVEPGASSRPRPVSDPLVVEWRALTVTLLDTLEPMVTSRLAEEGCEPLPVGFVAAATWTAGRKAAAERRPDGAPPIAVESDGTVF